jgi:isochorismate pyruvate lyase
MIAVPVIACNGYRAAASPGCGANREGARVAVAVQRVKLDRAQPACQAGGMTLAPEDCATMTDVRAGVDALDRALVALLATRFGYMRAAARIKPDRGHVRDEARKAQVIAQAVDAARLSDIPTDAVAAMWETLVEASIAYEMVEWGRLRPGDIDGGSSDRA